MTIKFLAKWGPLLLFIVICIITAICMEKDTRDNDGEPHTPFIDFEIEREKE